MPTQKIIDRQTTKIIQTVKEDFSGFYEKFFLDLDSVCKHFGVSLFEAEFPDENVSGALTKNNGDWSIVVNAKHPPSRRRFTIAHEVGHFLAIKYDSEIAKSFLESNDGIIKDYFVVNRSEEVDPEQYQVERQANMIAASILMPEDMVKNLYDQKVDIAEMAEKFGVSESAMSYRLKSLGLDSIETMYQ
jgi:Zn-dependent peptidase ImmA (M78 family)